MEIDGEIAEKIHTRDKLCTRYELTRLHVDKEIYKEMQNAVQNFIRKKKQAYFEEKLKENTSNLEKLQKTLKRKSTRKKDTFWHLSESTRRANIWPSNNIYELFKKFYSNLANDLI